MGLDIAFNKELALKAGLVLETRRNGTDAEVQEANDLGDTEHADWLSQVTEVFKVPNCEHYVKAYDNGSDFIVRANKWGHTYHPLTEWLKSHDIEWSEF